jgi:glyoxalase family protein
MKHLDYWVKRFDKYNVTHSGIYEQFGRKVIDFQDFDEQLYQLVSDEADTGVAPGIPWQKGPVPNEYGIRGLGPIFVRIADFNFYRQVLETVLGFRHADSVGETHLFEVGEGGNGGRMIVEHNATLGQAQQGFGSVHHMAFRVKDRKELEEWIAHMGSYRFPISGYVDRFYFESLYANIAQGILLEFATDGPGFIDDEEPYETLGERLALPPKFRNNREEIEGLVRQFDTVRSTKTFEKEYSD